MVSMNQFTRGQTGSKITGRTSLITNSVKSFVAVKFPESYLNDILRLYEVPMIIQAKMKGKKTLKTKLSVKIFSPHWYIRSWNLTKVCLGQFTLHIHLACSPALNGQLFSTPAIHNLTCTGSHYHWLYKM